MDPKIMELAQKITPFLLPVLPYLLKIGEKATEEIGKKIGEEAWEKAKALWGKLGRKDKVKTAAQAAVALPDNPATQQVLETEIARALEEDPTLLTEIAGLVAELKPAGNIVTASGSRSVAIGGDASGNIIITGDNNKL